MKKSRGKLLWITRFLSAVLGVGIVIMIILFFQKEDAGKTPDELLLTYMNHISEKQYEEMYKMLDAESMENISKEDFIKRNSAIYEAMETQNIKVKVKEYSRKEKKVSYTTSLDTVAGKIKFENEAIFTKGQKEYELSWSDSLIFPELESSDKVRVITTEAERGNILDRNGNILAGADVAYSVGVVPRELDSEQEAIQRISEVLELQSDSIEEQLTAQWVKEDSFVPLKTISKSDARQEVLLEIPGVMLTDTKVRGYPLGEAASHLTGYVQSVTAEDLKEHEGESYTTTSVIGKSGLESLYEKKLKGQNGYTICIVDKEEQQKKEMASVAVVDGEHIKTTIDGNLQTELFEQFKEDKSCSIAMNPYTGEILALVSTPSYNSNDFIMGMSDTLWNALNIDERKPLYNRFRQVWCPGSTFKPITAAIGLQSGAIDPSEDYGNEGLSWQKDSSWGSYRVTTLHEYSPVILENALIYSDNIYFAKAALKIGAEEMGKSMLKLGFNQDIPFEIKMSKSQYSNTDKIETEVQLADSGYGQGQIVVNPLHLSSIYTAFCNGGNIIKPTLLYQEEVKVEHWIENAFSDDVAHQVLEGMKKVINDPNGTGYGAHKADRVLAGKTGTAEIKESQEDVNGTELGWFTIFTADESSANPILITSMVEDVKDRGGSGYVVEKINVVLD